MEVSHSDGKKVLWEVIENHFIEYPRYNDLIIQQIFFMKTGGGG